MPLEVFMKSISSLYKDYLRKDLIIFDEKQLEVVSKIKGIIPKKFGIRERIIKLFYQRRNISKGIYLWGKEIIDPKKFSDEENFNAKLIFELNANKKIINEHI